MSATVHAAIRVHGQVQGVGFRPFVYRLAQELGLAGSVRNDGEGVAIVLEGAGVQVENMLQRLRSEPPLRARIDAIEVDLEAAPAGLQGFHIGGSAAGPAFTAVPSDVTLCGQCLDELFDPADRRFRYPFINCIHCGPRFTLTRQLPYDRPNTSMASFRLCADCQREYDDPASRRFHAQPNACPVCGPRLRLVAMPAGAAMFAGLDTDALAAAVRRLRAGEVVAVQGLGGFHLACDARAAAPLARLRGAKQRSHKPFAVMVPGLAAASRLALLDRHEAALLASPERPVVLLRKREAADLELPGVAPGLARIGLMLPHTPLHWLLFHEWMGRPAGSAWRDAEEAPALLMTSANPGGEPLVISEAEAAGTLAGLANALLVNDRAIVQRCDDSVMRCDAGASAFVRRARGFVPQRIRLPAAGPSVLACGAGLKNTVCVTRGDEAFVSQHIGDLQHPGARAMLADCVDHLCRITGVRPQAVAHDLHPDYFSTIFAAGHAAALGVPCLAVQHHHAHIAAVCAEHAVQGAVIGLALDGSGLGDDGGLWGGELLQVDGARSRRIGHLRTLPLAGGDQAARAPWRMAAAALHALGRADSIGSRFPGQVLAARLAGMLETGVNCPPSSSAGRWFDAAAGLLGVCETQTYEGQAAMQLEALAERHGAVPPFALDGSGPVLDLLPLLAVLANCADAAFGAALFHASLAEALAGWAAGAARREQLDTVVLAGGCLLNGVLAAALRQRLRDHGLRVLTAAQLPPNDGAISLGQAWVALQSLDRGS